MYSSQFFISALLDALYLNTLTTSIINKANNTILTNTINYILWFLFYLLILVIGTYCYNKAMLNVSKDIKTAIYKHYLYLNVEAPDTTTKNPISTINTEADMAIQIFTNPLANLLGCLISIVFSAISLFIIDYRIGIFSLLVGAISLLIQLAFTNPLAKNEKNKLEKTSIITDLLTKILQHITTIKAFNLQQKTEREMNYENNEFLQLSYKEAFISTWQNLFMTLQGWLSLTGVFIFGSILISKNIITLATLIMVPTLCSDLARGMGTLGVSWSAMQGPMQAVYRIEEILNGKPHNLKKEDTLIEKENTSYQLETNNLNFKYLNSPNYILSGINLTIKENTVHVFLGRSGAGKSTLLKVLLGLYERNDLSIQCGALDYNNTSTKQWNSLFAYIDQNYQLFDMSIEENIKLANKEASKEEIVSATKKADAYDFIMQLDAQFQTQINESGSHLSGGQKQRIAIARAIIKKAPILLFDEPTSALDKNASKKIMQTIEELKDEHTILLVTHQLKYLPNNAIIHFMEDGTIKESGTHDQLVGNQSYYYQYLSSIEHNNKNSDILMNKYLRR